MAKFSIKDIETVTGIKSHTLRVWEQRYGIIKPKRTETNIRYYDDEDLKIILNISILNSNGVKISHIASMNQEQIYQAVLDANAVNREYDAQIKSLIYTMLTLDEAGFNQILGTNILQFGLEDTMAHIIFPFMGEVGLLWQLGSIHVAHEHFITNLIRQKLYVAIDGQITQRAEGKKKFLLFLCENEPHEIGLLFANYMIKSRGHQVIYLGQNLPHDEFDEVFKFYAPEYLLTTLTSAISDEQFQALVDDIASSWPHSTIIMAGKQVVNREVKSLPSNVILVSDLSYFTAYLNGLSSDSFNKN